MIDLPSINYPCTAMHAGLLGTRCCSRALAAAGVLGCLPALGAAGLLGGSHAQASMNAFRNSSLITQCRSGWPAGRSGERGAAQCWEHGGAGENNECGGVGKE